MKTYTFVANWKMNFSFNQATAFALSHKEDFATLAQHPNAKVVLCPSFESIAPVYAILKDTGVFIGAQDCAMYGYGSYTGQVAASSLQEAGCSYVLVGHTERRLHIRETDHDIAGKAMQCLLYNLNPIICFGEDLTTYKSGKTVEVVQAQIEALKQSFSSVKDGKPVSLIHLAYEPAWSIGTGEVASPEHVEKVFEAVLKTVEELVPRSGLRMLYGGSVKNENHEMVIKIKELDGFLIGKASLDFQSFKNILDYTLEKASR